MSEWWTYSLSDFLLFSPRTYYRLIELYNADVWPLHVVMATTGVGIVTVLGRDTRGSRFAAVALGVCWGWVAWAFHLERYAQINWAAPWFAAAFALQGVLLAAWGVFASEFAQQARSSRALALALLALSVVVAYPVLAPLAGRAWTSSESFGIVPDPTALATLALVLRARGAMRWLLAVVPLAWCAIAAATLLAMESAQAYVVIGLALAALAFAMATRPAGPGPR